MPTSEQLHKSWIDYLRRNNLTQYLELLENSELKLIENTNREVFISEENKYSGVFVFMEVEKYDEIKDDQDMRTKLDNSFRHMAKGHILNIDSFVINYHFKLSDVLDEQDF